MPDRIIRDEILQSERYWSCSTEAQRLFIHLVLVVDDAARFSGKNFTIRAACFPARPIEPDDLERWISELTDADLIRLYQIEGQRYIFIPRTRQRKRYVASSKYPPPPISINDLTDEKSASRPTQVIPESAPSQPQDERGGVEVGLRRGEEEQNQVPVVRNEIHSRDHEKLPPITPPDDHDRIGRIAGIVTRSGIQCAPHQLFTPEWRGILALFTDEQIESAANEARRRRKDSPGTKHTPSYLIKIITDPNRNDANKARKSASQSAADKVFEYVAERERARQVGGTPDDPVHDALPDRLPSAR